ncbi:MAG: hypothetical protein IPF53_12455 [Blastocatellia bacterium]|jgi:hypothetical protein|nr:hypothetical protein [Blastocatellia bacterium]
MSKEASEANTSKILAIMTTVVAVVGIVASAWTAWYATSTASADSHWQVRETAATDCRRMYLERCDALYASVREAIVAAQQGKGVTAPMVQVHIRASSVGMFLDAEGSAQLKALVEQLEVPSDVAPLQLLNDKKDEKLNYQAADNLAGQIEKLLGEQRSKTCVQN